MFTSHNQQAAIPERMRREEGFTLLEVTLAMGILVLLAGALYAMVDASVLGTSELETRENHLQQECGFLAVCQQTFHVLPATALFEARLVRQGKNFAPELVFRNCPGFFQWRDTGKTSLPTILGVHQQPGGLSNLGILQDSEEGISSYLNSGTAKQPWLVLMPDLREVEWRFYDSRTRAWAKDWKEPSVRPLFAELSLTTEEGARKYVFWIPPVQHL